MQDLLDNFSGICEVEDMKNVTVNKEKLIQIVQSNRVLHRSQYEKAFEGYRKECMEVLEANLKSLQHSRCHIVVFREQAPEDHTEDYDRVIAMLKMSVDENVQLTSEEFSQYVQDNWQWKDRWSMSNFKYTSKA